MADQENTVMLNGEHLGSRKPRKPPPVTPKRFQKFFAPRSSASRGSKSSLSKAGRQLREITQSGLNRRAGQQPRTRSPKKTVVFDDAALSTPPSKRRKLYITPDSSPPQSSPCKNPISTAEPLLDLAIPSSPPPFLDEDVRPAFRSLSPEPRKAPVPIRRARLSGCNGRVLERSFGGMEGLGRARKRDNCSAWQYQTASFYSRPEDSHEFAHPALPFSTASCHTNTLVATGDESGTVRIIESAEDSPHSFSSTFLTFQPHTNAVMDLCFSSDDLMLATASGDQTSRIIDMPTQKTKYMMHEHCTSVKQVRFQPGNDNILATSSRDGSVQIWDMRCRADEVVVSETRRPSGLGPANELGVTYKAFAACTYNSIYSAHLDTQAMNEWAQRDSTTKAHARPGTVSVTAISFLSAPGLSHLLITGSEASTTLKLWDIRNRYSRHGTPSPLSTTEQPESHSRHRHFGINSIVLSGDGSKIYALSRDNTVYAYSTPHLMLGHAPEMSTDFTKKNHRSVSTNKTGLGPIYGFRHPMLHATSFYVKASLRKAKDDKSEMLAVGSAEGCSILFPTDETFLARQMYSYQYPDAYSRSNGSDIRDSTHSLQATQSRDSDEETSIASSPSSIDHIGTETPPASSPAIHALQRPMPRRTASSGSLATRMQDSIPIYDNIGTPLLSGHEREVTGLSWTSNGDLITVSDDYTARCWREGPKAREMRMREGKHERWGWGLADIGASGVDGWDGDED